MFTGIKSDINQLKVSPKDGRAATDMTCGQASSYLYSWAFCHDGVEV